MAKYVGGPCDGLGVGNQTGQTLVCAGVTYTRGADGDYHLPQGAVGPIGPDALGARGPRGWADLQKAVNVSIPTGTSKAKVLTRAAHRKLMQRRRIR